MVVSPNFLSSLLLSQGSIIWSWKATPSPVEPKDIWAPWSWYSQRAWVPLTLKDAQVPMRELRALWKRSAGRLGSTQCERIQALKSTDSLRVQGSETGQAPFTSPGVFPVMQNMPSEDHLWLWFLVSPWLSNHSHRPGLVASSGNLWEGSGGLATSQPGSWYPLNWWSPFQPQPLQPASACLWPL